jgi:integrin beta 3
MPGIAGERGIDGKDGVNGKDGADGVDGLGFDDIEFDGERTISFVRGEKRISFVLPIAIYRGVRRGGEVYERGDMVSYGGSVWHAAKQTDSTPGEGNQDWTLAVKRGRDGKDGKEGERGPQGLAATAIKGPAK